MKRRSCEIYVASFLARCVLLSGPDRARVDEPGVHGVPPSAGDPSIRLLVTDDRGYDRVAALIPEARAGMISIFAAAERCAGLFGGHPPGAPTGSRQ